MQTLTALCQGLHKAADPDNIPGRVLMTCAHQLSEADIFQHLSATGICPHMLKDHHYCPSPQALHNDRQTWLPTYSFNISRQEVLESLVNAHIKDSIDVTADPHQFAYRKNCSIVDAISSVYL